MKLISCHIENFGKLRDFTYYFEDGLSVLFAENGWGKSTFAAFLKVMFYGFDGDNRRNEDGNERLRFRPWGGGVYGGSVIWSRGGKSYRMLRTFGTRRKEDTFALYDEVTGLPSSDFSENIGEELFGIDRDSFRRTVFWSQSDHDTSATTSIQAKIGDLSSQQDDFPAYDDAVKRLRREMDRLRPDRASGLIRKKEDRLSVLQADEARLPLLEARLEECKAGEQTLTAELDDIRARRQQYSLSASAAPAVQPQADHRGQELLEEAERKLAMLLERDRSIQRRGQKERREYLRVKNELQRELVVEFREQQKQADLMRAGAGLALASAVIFLVLCLSGILPAPMVILPVLLLAAGGAIFWQSGRIRGTEPETDEILRLRGEKDWYSDSLRTLRRKMEKNRNLLREQQAVCETLRRKSDMAVTDRNIIVSSEVPEQISPEVSGILAEYDRQEEDCRIRLQEVRSQAEELGEMIRDCRSSAALIPGLRCEIDTLREQYDTCVLTLSYLEEARNSFTSRYMNPFLRSFSRYYSMLTGDSADAVRTDADFSITIMEEGLPRDPSLMSEGSRDLISLCRRMAMIDAMYPGEKPFLVLDDPFSNLDDERVKGGLRFLHSASLEYQILYLTCHKSRF
jgi:hypothetical protein